MQNIHSETGAAKFRIGDAGILGILKTEDHFQRLRNLCQIFTKNQLECINKIGLLWCHSHVELRLIEVEVD